MKTLLLVIFISTNIFANYSQLLFNGNCVTCHSTDDLNKSAPNIKEIQSRYKSAFQNKKDFVIYMSTWVYKPSVETSIMSDAIKKYELMPELAYDMETLKEISAYIYENDFNKNK